MAGAVVVLVGPAVGVASASEAPVHRGSQGGTVSAAASRAAEHARPQAGRAAVPKAAWGPVARALSRDDPAYRAGIRQARLTASDGAAGDSLGGWVAISADGNTIVAAASAATIGGSFAQGAVYVFTKPRGGWRDATQTAKLTASDGAAFDNLGWDGGEGSNGLAISADGNTIVAGAAGPYDSAPGAVYVFTKPRRGWHNETQTAKLTASNGGSGDNLGSSVAISGNVIASGAPEATVNGNQVQGEVYIFVKPTGGWRNERQAAKLTASDGGELDGLGSAVAISGRTVTAGAPGATVNGNQGEGAAYVFIKPRGGWRSERQAAKLTASDGTANANFAVAVAMYRNIVMIGATAATVNGNQGQGAAYIFARPRTGWQNTTQTAELTASNAAPDQLLGASVAIFGPTAAAGGVGGIWVFAEPRGGWLNQTSFAEVTNPDYGLTEALSRNALAVGASNASVNGNQGQGAVDVIAYGSNGIRRLAAAQTTKTTPTPPHVLPGPSPSRERHRAPAVARPG
jgi:hypothetical protein